MCSDTVGLVDDRIEGARLQMSPYRVTTRISSVLHHGGRAISKSNSVLEDGDKNTSVHNVPNVVSWYDQGFALDVVQVGLCDQTHDWSRGL